MRAGSQGTCEECFSHLHQLCWRASARGGAFCKRSKGKKKNRMSRFFFLAQAFGEALRKDRDGSAEISMLFDVICHWWKVSELEGGSIA